MENVDYFGLSRPVNARNSRSIREINASLYCIADMTKIHSNIYCACFLRTTSA